MRASFSASSNGAWDCGYNATNTPYRLYEIFHTILGGAFVLIVCKENNCSVSFRQAFGGGSQSAGIERFETD